VVCYISKIRLGRKISKMTDNKKIRKEWKVWLKENKNKEAVEFFDKWRVFVTKVGFSKWYEAVVENDMNKKFTKTKLKDK